MDAKIRARAQKLRDENPEMTLWESHAEAFQATGVSEGVPADLREPGCDDDQGCEPSAIGKVLADVVHQVRKGGENPFDRGPRDKGEPRPVPGPAKRGEKKPRRRLSPTYSERKNRALVELSFSGYKIHDLLWTWRGSPARGNLPFFTLKSLAKFCGTDRMVVRRALKELVSKGWIKPGQYDCHKKNSLFKLVPIEEVPKVRT